LWGWGDNGNHELGLDTDVTNKNVPTQIGIDTDWSIAAILGRGTGAISVAIKTDGTMYWWGDAADNGTGYDVPTQIGSATDWAFVTGDHRGGLAIKTDGSVYCYGENPGARFTTGPAAEDGFVSSWTQIAAITGVCSHCSTFSDDLSNSYSLFVIDGELFGVGDNGAGDTSFGGWLGDGTATNRTSLVQVGSDTDWQQVMAAGYVSYAIKSTGAIYSFGSHQSGACGLGVTGIDAYLTPQLMDSSVSRLYIPGGVDSSGISSSYADFTTGGVVSYHVTFTGDGMAIDDIEVPVSSFSGSLRDDSTSYGLIVVPGLTEYLTAINERIDNNFTVVHRRTQADGSVTNNTIMTCPITGLRIDEGGNSRSITVRGSVLETAGSLQAVEVPRTMVSYRYSDPLSGTDSVPLRFRLPVIPEIRPGDIVHVGDETIPGVQITYNVSRTENNMEISYDQAFVWADEDDQPATMYAFEYEFGGTFGARWYRYRQVVVEA
jgi:hypothetical protein